MRKTMFELLQEFWIIIQCEFYPKCSVTMNRTFNVTKGIRPTIEYGKSNIFLLFKISNQLHNIVEITTLNQLKDARYFHISLCIYEG